MKKGKARNIKITPKGYILLAGIESYDRSLTEEQGELLCKLAQIDLKLVSKFLGGLAAYQGPDYSERLNHAAHSFRGIAATLALMAGCGQDLLEVIYDGKA